MPKFIKRDKPELHKCILKNNAGIVPALLKNSVPTVSFTTECYALHPNIGLSKRHTVASSLASIKKNGEKQTAKK